MKYLFIGGNVDGEWIYVPDNHNFWKILIQPQITTSQTIDVNYDECLEMPHIFNEEVYRGIHVNGIKVYIHQDLQESEVIKILIENYKPKSVVDNEIERLKSLLNYSLKFMLEKMYLISNKSNNNFFNLIRTIRKSL